MIIAKSMAMKIDNDPTHVMTFYLLYIYFLLELNSTRKKRDAKSLFSSP